MELKKRQAQFLTASLAREGYGNIVNQMLKLGAEDYDGIARGTVMEGHQEIAD